MIIRPRYTVIGGAAIGLIAASTVYGAVSTASSATSATPATSTTLTKLAPAALTPAPAPAARCAAGEELDHGVCVIHVQRTVVRPAPSVVPADDTVMAAVPDASGGTGQGRGPSSSGEHATEVGEPAAEARDRDAAEAEYATEDAHDAVEHPLGDES